LCNSSGKKKEKNRKRGPTGELGGGGAFEVGKRKIVPLGECFSGAWIWGKGLGKFSKARGGEEKETFKREKGGVLWGSRKWKDGNEKG